jgi:hypothetical protein
VETGQNGALLRLLCPRIHSKPQADEIVSAVLALPQDQPITLDVSGVKSFGSGVWEDICALCGMWSIHVSGLSGACRENFYAWDFDAVIRPADGPAQPGGPA